MKRKWFKNTLAFSLAAAMTLACLPAAAAETGELQELTSDEVCYNAELDIHKTGDDGEYMLASLDEYGIVELKEGNYVNWIDRVDIPDYALDFYDRLIEGSDNDGNDDFLITSRDEEKSTVTVKSFNLPSDYTSETTDNYWKEAVAYAFAAYASFNRDHPEVFWMSGKMSISANITADSSGSVFNVFINLMGGSTEMYLIDEYKTSDSIRTAIATRDECVNNIISAATSSSNTVFDNIKGLHDWLTMNNEYNTKFPDSPSSAWTCLSALTGSIGENGPVCEGYSRAFKVLCDKLGIPCVLVDGKASYKAGDTPEDHMWNYVQIFGLWYAVDVTWDDPVIDGVSNQKVSGGERDVYLTVGSSSEFNDLTFIESHPVKNTLGSDYEAYIPCFTNGPVLNTTAYTDAVIYALTEKAVKQADGSYSIKVDSDLYMDQDLTINSTVDFNIGEGGSLDFKGYKMLTGMGATTEVDGEESPQLTIYNSSNNLVFQARALGGQLRYDNKLNDEDELYGTYSETGSKEKASDYADLRLSYSFDVPENIDNNSLNWSWKVQYGDNDPVTLKGVKYTWAENGDAYTFNSNVVLTNIPATTDVDLQTWLTVTYKINGNSYTFVQADTYPLERTLHSIINSYTDTQVDERAWKYVSNLQDIINDNASSASNELWTPVA